MKKANIQNYTCEGCSAQEPVDGQATYCVSSIGYKKLQNRPSKPMASTAKKAENNGNFTQQKTCSKHFKTKCVLTEAGAELSPAHRNERRSKFNEVKRSLGKDKRQNRQYNY